MRPSFVLAILVVVACGVARAQLPPRDGPDIVVPSAQPDRPPPDVVPPPDSPAPGPRGDSPAGLPDSPDSAPAEEAQLKHEFTAPYDEMARKCKLDAKQQDELKKIVDARDKAIAQLETRNAAQRDAAQKKLDAPKLSDAQRAALTKSMETLNERQAASVANIEQQHEQRAMAILTPEQKGIWNGDKLAPHAYEELAPAELTEEQKQQVLELCRTAGARLGFVSEKTAVGPTNGVVRQAFVKLLDTEQKKKYTAAKQAQRGQKPLTPARNMPEPPRELPDR